MAELNVGAVVGTLSEVLAPLACRVPCIIVGRSIYRAEANVVLTACTSLPVPCLTEHTACIASLSMAMSIFVYSDVLAGPSTQLRQSLATIHLPMLSRTLRRKCRVRSPPE
jgi:hypothetical protein